MINSNYFLYFCAIFTIFFHYTDAQKMLNPSPRDPASDTNVVLIPETDPNHPRSLCKIAMNDNNAKWNDGFFVPTPADVCSKNVRCYAAGKPQKKLTLPPVEGAECVSLEAVNNGAYRYACLAGSCVPFKKYPKIGRNGK